MHQMVWSNGLSPGGGVGVEQPALAAGGHRHADRVADALAERAGGGLDAGGVAVLGVAGGERAPLAQVREVLERQAVAGQEQLRVERDAGVAAGQHEAVAARPRSGRSGRGAGSAGTAGWPAGARLIAVPGWPEPAASTASMARARATSTVRRSRSDHSRVGTGSGLGHAGPSGRRAAGGRDLARRPYPLPCPAVPPAANPARPTALCRDRTPRPDRPGRPGRRPRR